MQLQMTTDYAMRIIGYMLSNDALEKNTLVKAKSMAEEVGVDYQYSMKVINKLKSAGILISVQGCAGGYFLDESVKDLTFYDIIKLMEGEINLLKCLDGGNCSRTNDKSEECPVHCQFEKLQSELTSKLKEIRMQEVCANGF